jgi:hypothetical protein
MQLAVNQPIHLAHYTAIPYCDSVNAEADGRWNSVVHSVTGDLTGDKHFMYIKFNKTSKPF